MFDINKFTEVYNVFKKLTPEDTLQLIIKVDDEKVRLFYMTGGNSILQQKTKESDRRESLKIIII